MNGLRSRSRSDRVEKGTEAEEGGGDGSGGKKECEEGKECGEAKECEEMKECEEDLVVAVGGKVGRSVKKGSVESNGNGKESEMAVLVSGKKKDGRGRPRKNAGSKDGESGSQLNLIEKASEAEEGGDDMSGGKKECEELMECEEDLAVAVDRQLGQPMEKGSVESDSNGKESEKVVLVSGKKKDGRGRPRKNEGSKDGESGSQLNRIEKGSEAEEGGDDMVGVKKECEELMECEEDLVVAADRQLAQPMKKGSVESDSNGKESEKGVLVSGKKKDGRGRPRKNEGSKDGESGSQSNRIKKGCGAEEGGDDMSGGKKECEELMECEEDLVVAVDRKLGQPMKKGSVEADSNGKESEKGVLVSGKKKDGRGRPRKNVGSKDGVTGKKLTVFGERKLGQPRKNKRNKDGESEESMLVLVAGEGGDDSSHGKKECEEPMECEELGCEEDFVVAVAKKPGRPRKNGSVEPDRNGKESEKSLLVSGKKKDGRGRLPKTEGSNDEESGKKLSVSGKRKRGRPRKNKEKRGRPRKYEGSGEGESDKDLVVSGARKAAHPGKNKGGSDSVVEKSIIGSTNRKKKPKIEKIENTRSHSTSDNMASDKDLLVSVQRKVGRPRKDTGSSDSFAGEKSSIDAQMDGVESEVDKKISWRKPMKCREDAQTGRKKVKKDGKGPRINKVDVYEYSEDGLVDHKIEGLRGVDDERKLKSCPPVKRKREDGEIEDKQSHSAITLEEKTKLHITNHMLRNGGMHDALVPVDTKNVERSGKASGQSEKDKNTGSRGADCPIGKRTRSSVKLKIDIQSSQSPPISVEKISVKKRKKNHSRKIKKNPSTSGKKGRKGRSTLAAEPCVETELPKKRKRNELKQSVSDKIKSMVHNAGWKIDYRLRASRDYKDAVYVDHAGTAYWSVLRAYYALEKQYGDNNGDRKHCETGFLFTPIPEELLNILKRQTEKGKKKVKRKTGIKSADKEVTRKKKCDGMEREKQNGLIRNKGKSLKVRLAKKGFKLDKKIGHRRPRSHKAVNDRKNPIPKTAEAKNASLLSKSRSQARKSKTQRGYSLLVRKSDQEMNSSGDNFIAYAGKRTILSWLIDSQIVSLGDKVKYMNKTHSQPLLEGFITRDGINCGCCSEIVTIQEFEAHAGSKLCQPFRNIFVETGISLIQCQIDAWNKQEESERSGYHCIDIRSDDPNDDTCGICGDGGDLMCCDGCPSTFHQSCIGIQVLPKGDWHCFNCCCKFCGVVGSSGGEEDDVTISTLLTCSLCEEKYHGSCILQTNDISVASGVLSTFCGQNCRELSEKLQKLIGVRHELEAGFSWTVIQRSDLESEKFSCELSQKVECNSKLALALSIMDECFLPTVDERSGIKLIHNVVYNCGSNFNRLNYGGFYTFVLERGDEIISAASIRIHGSKFAEMPFIGTRYMYRRQGMCRRLLNAIEMSLSYLNVEKLIIPAISELLDTWTKVFGFMSLEETFKHELKSLNMLVFPGVALLQKLPPKHDLAELRFINSSAFNAAGHESNNHTTSEATDKKDDAGGIDLGSAERAVEAKSPSQDESSTYTTETNTLLKNSNAESSLYLMEGSVTDGETKSSTPNTTDVLNASLSTVSDSVFVGSNSKINSDATQYIELESKPLEVSPEELHTTHCEESTHHAFDNAKRDANQVEGTAVNVQCHASEENKQPRKKVFNCNLEDGLEGQAFESPQKVESDSNTSGAEDSFFDAADSFHVVGKKVTVTESKSKSMDGDSDGCTKITVEPDNAVINGGCASYTKSKGDDFLPNSCKSSSEVLNASDLGKESTHNVGDESLAVLPGGSDIKDSPDIVAEYVSQVSNGVCCTSEDLLSAPGIKCDTAANDTSTESKCIRNHSAIPDLQESGEQDVNRISELQRSS